MACIEMIRVGHVRKLYLLFNLNVSCKFYSMKTLQRVAQICCRLGYATKERKLIDWCQKGLIPPLKAKGRGRGKGKFYYWDSDKYIVTQILATEGLMNWYRRPKYVLLMLWFNGFDVNTKLVRETWLSFLDGRNQFLASKYPDPFDLEERIDRMILSQSNYVTVSEKAIRELMQIVYKITLSNQFELADKLSEVITMIAQTELLDGQDPAHFLYTFLSFFNRHFSPESKVELLQTVDDKGLAEAQADWATVIRFIEPLLRATQPQDYSAWPDLRIAQLWWQIISNLGGNVILLDLALRKEGFSKRIEQTVSYLKDRNVCIALERELRASLLKQAFSRRACLMLGALFSDIVCIWTDAEVR